MPLPVANEPLGCCAVLTACLYANELDTDTERTAFRRIIEGRNVFQGYDAAELIDQANALFTEAGSSERLIDAAVSVVAAHNRLPLFLHCLEVILADGVVTPREHKILHYLKGKLHISDDVVWKAMEILVAKSKL
jgi:uncharacterized tellurite resistance protein B-like protein